MAEQVGPPLLPRLKPTEERWGKAMELQAPHKEVARDMITFKRI
jgi:hypothetical protein